MFGLCAFFAVVLTVVCDDVVKDKAAGFGPQLGQNVVNSLMEISGVSWSAAKYNIPLEGKVERYLNCMWQQQPEEDDSSSEDSSAKCKKEIEGSVLVHGAWDELIQSPREIVEKVEYWSSGAKGGGVSVLKEAIEKAKEKGFDNVGCAFYYTDVIYATAEGKGQNEASGDLACVFATAN